MKKLNKKQKEKVKTIIFKVLHVISYILSALFILSMIIFGAQSCKKTRGVSAESIDVTNRNIVYTLRSFDNPYFLSSEEQTSLSDDNVDCTYIYSNDPGNYVYTFDTPNLYLLYDDEQYSISYIRLIYLSYSYEHNNSTYYKRYLYEVRYFFDNVTPLGDNVQVTISTGTATMAYHNQFTNVKLLLTDEPFIQNYFDFYYNISNTSSFTFNKTFNYNAPMGTSLSTPYYFRPANILGSGVSYYLKYDVGWFVSNGELFDYIRWEWSPSLGAVYYDFGDGNIKKGPDGNEQGNYVYLMYGNSVTNTLKIVNSRDQVAFMPTSSSYGYYYRNSSTWANDSYRYITFLQDLPSELKTKIDAFNNNNQNYYNGNVVSGDINNIFTLIASAFSSWVPIMSVYLLPGITIGTLIFIPLVALLVFAIIRIIKK